MDALPYHRLARASEKYRWWRPLVELVAFGVLVIAAWLIVFPILIDQFGEADAGAAGIIKIGISIAVALPAALIAARISGRPAGSLSSIAGRLRLGWLGTCVLVSVGFIVLGIGAYTLAAALGADVGPPRGGWVGFDAFWPLALAVVAVIPFQAAAEEYAFRGILMQALGAWVSPSVVAIAVSSVLFGLAHGLGIQGFIAITVFGLVAAWLTVRTGGLEAAIALHVINNVTMFMFDAATGRGGVWVTELNAHITWVATAIDVASNLLYGAIIARLHARRSASASAGASR